MKTIVLVLLFTTATYTWAAESSPPATKSPGENKTCCQTAVVPKSMPACCQAEMSGTPVSKDSIYQLEGRFTDDAGRPFSLSSLRGRPVVLDLFFASCSYACPLAVTDMLALQEKLPPSLRQDTVFVLVSFDVARDTPAALANFRRQRQLDGNWVLLHGDDTSVRELAAVLGVQYRETSDGAFTHTNQITILNRAGEIIHTRKGLQGGLAEAAQSLVQSSQ